MPGYDDETETSSGVTSDPALDATVEGGMGIVYRARDPELKRDVAIKVVGGSRAQLRTIADRGALDDLVDLLLGLGLTVSRLESLEKRSRR